MLRKRKCPECGQTFRTADPNVKVCQNCSGSHDNTKQAEREAEAGRKANASVRKRPQSVDPRTGLPPEPPAPTKKGAKSNNAK